MLIREPLHVLVVIAIIIVGTSLAAFFLVLLFRYPLNTALTVSASLAQIGEFSFILAGLGISLGLMPAMTAESKTGTEIGRRLFISPRTVKFHRQNLMRKLSLRNQGELIRYALKKGIFPNNWLVLRLAQLTVRLG